MQNGQLPHSISQRDAIIKLSANIVNVNSPIRPVWVEAGNDEILYTQLFSRVKYSLIYKCNLVFKAMEKDRTASGVKDSNSNKAEVEELVKQTTAGDRDVISELTAYIYSNSFYMLNGTSLTINPSL